MSTTGSTREYRERLIDEVKKYPVLYDTGHEGHRDIDTRDKCWAEIAHRMGGNSEVLKREWKILRDSLRQSMKKCRKGATTKAGTPCRKWRFHQRMAFVLPYMTRRSERPILRSGSGGIKPDVDVPSEHDEPSPALSDDAPLLPVGAVASLDLFFASVCQSARRLPTRAQAALKRQVLDALLRIEEEWQGNHDAAHDPDDSKMEAQNF